jgi:hypothetical protein
MSLAINSKIGRLTILELIRASTESNTTLGKRFGVTRTAIYLIRQGRNWVSPASGGIQ